MHLTNVQQITTVYSNSQSTSCGDPVCTRELARRGQQTMAPPRIAPAPSPAASSSWDDVEVVPGGSAADMPKLPPAERMTPDVGAPTRTSPLFSPRVATPSAAPESSTSVSPHRRQSLLTRMDTVTRLNRSEPSMNSPGRASRKSAPPPPLQLNHDYAVHVPGLFPEEIEVSLNTAGQHTLSWRAAIYEGRVQVLPAGQVNLYLFPAIAVFGDDRDTIVDSFLPQGEQLEALHRLIVALAADDGCALFQEHVADEVGALLVHAIVLANTPQAVELTERVIFARPSLLTQVHTKHRLGFPLFAGEGTLHVLAVNRQEELLCRLIKLAMRRDGPSDLTEEQARAVFSSQACGVFFNDMPMRFYGGSPLSYASCFELREAVRTLLDTGLVSLNDRSNTCPLTGFHPIHAVVASGSTAMYEFISSELPREMQADTSILSAVGRLSLNMQGLSPLALATKLGDHAMVKHILRKQCAIVWVWGPVTAYSMDLDNIDSAGDGGTDMMELVARLDAEQGTTTMLLESFLGGFLYKLFLQKWKLYGRVLHYPRLCVDVAVLVMLIIFAFLRKEHPYDAQTTSVLRWLFGIMGCVMVFNLLFEIHINYLYWQRISASFNDGLNGAEPDRLFRLSTLLPNLLQFMLSNKTHFFCLSYLATFVGCALALSYVEDDPVSRYDHVYDNATDVVVHRLLRGAGGGGGSATTSSRVIMVPVGYSLLGEVPGDESNLTAIMWLCLAVAILTIFPYLADGLFVPYEGFNILMISVGRILQHDLRVFMVVFCFFVLEFGLSLYILYPRAGTIFMAQVDQFNTWQGAIKSMVELAVTGSPADIDLAANWSELSHGQILNFALFLILYVFYGVLALILLLNLLVAMLSSTYDQVRDESTLQSRTAFAQLMMRHELVSSAWGLSAHVGEHKGNGKYAYDFRSCASLDGGEVTDPFADKKALAPLARLEKKFDDLAKLVKGVEEKLEVKTTIVPLRAATNQLGGDFKQATHHLRGALAAVGRMKTRKLPPAGKALGKASSFSTKAPSFKRAATTPRLNAQAESLQSD